MREIILGLILLLGLPAFSQEQMRVDNKNKAFGFGEKLTYKVRYNLYFNINVGEIIFHVQEEPKEIKNETYYRVVGKGRTFGFYDAFFKVRDHYETYIHTENMLPKVFIRMVREGGYEKDEYVVFDHTKNVAKNKAGKQIDIPSETQDVLSVLYFARSLDFSSSNPGDSFMVNAFIDDTTYFVGLRYMGVEKISSKFGKISCHKIKPMLVVDRIFESEDDMTLWVTADENKIPLRIESGISVGAIRADLVEYEGVKKNIGGK